MAYVTITKDLTQVKSKVVFGLTRRQLLFFALAALVAVPIYFLTRRSLSTDIALMLLIVTALPFFFLALYEKTDNRRKSFCGIISASVYSRGESVRIRHKTDLPRWSGRHIFRR